MQPDAVTAYTLFITHGTVRASIAALPLSVVMTSMLLHRVVAFTLPPSADLCFVHGAMDRPAFLPSANASSS